jgi:hypothetical protein
MLETKNNSKTTRHYSYGIRSQRSSSTSSFNLESIVIEKLARWVTKTRWYRIITRRRSSELVCQSPDSVDEVIKHNFWTFTWDTRLYFEASVDGEV